MPAARAPPPPLLRSRRMPATRTRTTRCSARGAETSEAHRRRNSRAGSTPCAVRDPTTACSSRGWRRRDRRSRCSSHTLPRTPRPSAFSARSASHPRGTLRRGTAGHRRRARLRVPECALTSPAALPSTRPVSAAMSAAASYCLPQTSKATLQSELGEELRGSGGAGRDTRAGGLHCPALQQLVDRRCGTVQPSEQHDFAVQVVALDAARPPLQALP